MRLISQPGNDEALTRLIDEVMVKEMPVDVLAEDTSASILNAIMQAETPVIPLRSAGKAWPWRRIASVAALAVIFLSGAWFLFFKNPEVRVAATEDNSGRFKNDVSPGGNKAILTLADGSRIILDSANNGALAKQGNTKVLKITNGQLSYATQDNAGPVQVLYNTISTPRGGQYMVVLPDGSKVWLNAVSSLRFPTAFIGNERKVEITGEAYFEVEKNKAMPFRVYITTPGVESEGTMVEALGTSFNIMAYGDEKAINTTLLTGAVKITRGSTIGLLKPGQQSMVNTSGQMKLVEDAEVDEAVAWKNDLFLFNNTDIPAAMRQIARWYDVDVAYQGNISGGFNGGISRKVNISQVLKMLELTEEAHFKIEGKRVIVTP